MGLFKWIKKELESTNFHKRRESAPPVIGSFNPDITRDEAYIKALNKFNEWRTNQRHERLTIDNSDANNIYNRILNESNGIYDVEEVSAEGGSSKEELNKLPSNVQTETTTDSDGAYKKFNINSPTSTYEPPAKKKSSKRKAPQIKIRRYSPPYQCVVNKHGDVVEYALPYSEQNYPKEEGTTDEKQTSVESIPNLNDAMPLYNPEIYKRDYTMITDLDKSNEIGGAPFEEQNSILRELSSLENWSETINKTTPLGETFINEKLVNGIIVSNQNDIWCRTGVLQSSYLSSIELSMGLFRNTNVCFRTNTKKLRGRNPTFLSRMALERDYEILSVVKHTDIALLMAISYEENERNKFTLIMEPFDYTLNYVLYELQQNLSFSQTIKLINQITSAVIYLHECGYIHSNISSHAILVRKTASTICAKLSCFELTTQVSVENVQNEISALAKDGEEDYIQQNELHKLSEYILLLRNNQKHLKEKYADLTRGWKERQFEVQMENERYELSRINKNHLPYNTGYRLLFSYYNYQAPEILKSGMKYVYPTKSCDVYSLSLLLWEILNNTIPFVIFNRFELEKLYGSENVTNSNILPNFERKRCYYFEKLIKYGLQVDATKRIANVKHFALLLNNIKNELVSYGIFMEDENCMLRQNPVNEIPEYSNIIGSSNMMSSDHPIYEKTNYAYLSNDHLGATDDSKSIQIQKTHGELSNNLLSSLNMTKSPDQNKTRNKEFSNLSSFDQFMKTRNNVIYERTSTLKNRRKPNDGTKPKKSVKDLFNNNEKMEHELNLIPDEIKYSKDDFLKEFETNKKADSPLLVQVKETEIFSSPKSHPIMKETPSKEVQTSPVVNEIPTYATPKNNAGLLRNMKKNVVNSCPSSYRFNVGDFSLPDTPIARKNKLRRNAWLSNQNQRLGTPKKQPPTTPIIVTPVQIDTNMTESPSPSKKNVNVSIKILHNNKNINNEKTDENDNSFGMNCMHGERFSNISADISKCLNEKLKDIMPDFTEKILNELKAMAFNKNDNTGNETTPTKSSTPPDMKSLPNTPPELPKSKQPDTLDVEDNQVNIQYDYDALNNNSLKSKQNSLIELNSTRQHIPSKANQTLPQNLNESQSTINISEIIAEARRRQRSRSVINDFTMGHSELNRIDENSEEDTPSRVSVLEAVKRIENMSKCENSPRRLLANQIASSPLKGDDQKMIIPTSISPIISTTHQSPSIQTQASPHQPTLTYVQGGQTLIKRTIFRESIYSDQATNSVDASTTTTNSLRRKMTTRVTVNFRKTQSRTASDIGLPHSLSTTGSLPRHSICGEEILRLVEKKRLSENSVSEIEELRKLFCNHCREIITPDQIKMMLEPQLSLLQIEEGTTSIGHSIVSGRMSDASNPPKIDTKSTEDLYIDDDFCQGICLGANMELVSPDEDEDDEDFLRSIDFDIHSEYQPPNSLENNPN